MDALSTILARAAEALGAGRLAEAENLCGRVRAEAPECVDALTLGCVLAARRGRRERALDMIRRAVDLAPERADLHNTLGQALAAAGDADRALAAFERALSLNPGFAEVHYNLGLALQQRGRHPEAAERFVAAADLHPDWAEAHFRAANAMSALGDREAAAAGYRRVLALKPDSVEALYNLGGALRALDRLSEAREAYRAAVALRPEFAMAWNNLGVVQKGLGDLTGALVSYGRALALEPDNPETLNNLGNLLERLDRMEEAAAHCRRAVALRPDFAEAHNNLGVALCGAGRREAGDAAFGRALALRPGFTEARFNLAVTRLLMGDFDSGWTAYESRFDRADWTHIHPHRYDLPRWQGEPFKGRRLYVHDEQGFGDTIQFVRYLPQVKALGGTVIFETRPPLLPLLENVPGADTVVVRPKDPVPAAPCDLSVPLMSLAGIFGTDEKNIHAPVPYLRPDPERAARWQKIVGLRGLRVGLVWAGSPNHEQDRRRSCPLEIFVPLAGIPGVRLFGLQKGPAADAAEASAFLQANLGADFADFADAAGAMASLDLVISVDTAAAHLAGALGKEVWTLVPCAPDWRWGLAGNRTPWYPTMTLFRQKRSGDWNDVVARVLGALRDRVEAALGDEAGQGAPATPEEGFRRAASAHAAGRRTRAETLCREILARWPDHAMTLNLAAVLAQCRGEEAAALSFLDRAVAAAPEDPGLHRNRGRLLEGGEKTVEATRAYARAAELAPDDPEPALALARTLAAGKHYEPAESTLRSLLASHPGHVPGLNQLGTLLGSTGREAEAMTAFEQALTVDPASADAWTNKGTLLHARGELAGALAAFDRALEIAPGHAGARFNRGQVRLLSGDLPGGWADYEARREKIAWQKTHPELSPDRIWHGEPLDAGTLFVWEEQGLGDTLQFVRYLSRVRARCRRLILRCTAPLVPLLSGQIDADVVAAGDGDMAALGTGDRFVPLLSLPGIFGTSLGTVPAKVPYLFADPKRKRLWKERMPGNGLRIGLVWAGNPGHANDSRRSCRLETLAPLLDVAGATRFGLQKGAGAGQTETLAPARRLVNLGPDLADFADTAAVLENLDLVVTVDTAVAHLAGAMGKPVWVMLPAVPDWRWLMDREDSPWYPSMRLFRQKPGEGWETVAERIAVALRDIVQERSLFPGTLGRS